MAPLSFTNSLVLMSLFGVLTAQGQSPICDFECMHDSICSYCDGDAMIGDVELCRYGDDDKGRHCQCQPGWSGFRCGHAHESCYGTDHSCFNGGRCIPGLEDQYGTSQYFCDCSEAKDTNGNHFVGKSCEIAAIQPCDMEGNQFCVNNKTCSATAAASDVDFCQCGDDFEGPHCEFVKDQVPVCDLECKNDGKCALGIKDYALAELGYNDFWENHIEAMHCQCLSGFFGVQCEIAAQECGEHHCFNGATCVKTTIDDAGDSYHCDCKTAHLPHESFAGLYCQYKSNVFCETTDAIEGRDFCVNGGTCKVGAPGCNCTEGFEGPMCEFDAQIQGGEPDCTLSCANDGVCTKGVKDMEFLEKMGVEVAHLKDATHNGKFEYCTCKQGFFGLICDKTIDQCGSGDFVCMNGGRCAGDESSGWSCNCDVVGGDEKRFTGTYCQHEASVYCTPDNKPGMGNERLSYCANGGTCKSTAEGDGHTGCNCPSDFEGDHCELPYGAIENAIKAAESDRPTRSEGLTVFVVILLIVLIVLTGAVVYRRRLARKDEREKDIVLRDACMCAPAPTHSTVHSMMDDSNDVSALDFGPEQDGTELEFVEII